LRGFLSFKRSSPPGPLAASFCLVPAVWCATSAQRGSQTDISVRGLTGYLKGWSSNGLEETALPRPTHPPTSPELGRFDASADPSWGHLSYPRAAPVGAVLPAGWGSPWLRLPFSRRRAGPMHPRGTRWRPLGRRWAAPATMGATPSALYGFTGGPVGGRYPAPCRLPASGPPPGLPG